MEETGFHRSPGGDFDALTLEPSCRPSIYIYTVYGSTSKMWPWHYIFKWISARLDNTSSLWRIVLSSSSRSWTDRFKIHLRHCTEKVIVNVWEDLYKNLFGLFSLRSQTGHRSILFVRDKSSHNHKQLLTQSPRIDSESRCRELTPFSLLHSKHPVFFFLFNCTDIMTDAKWKLNLHLDYGISLQLCTFSPRQSFCKGHEGKHSSCEIYLSINVCLSGREEGLLLGFFLGLSID